MSSGESSDISDETLQELINSCFKVKELAYCPYSKFRVGAALLCKDGEIITGCNVENCAYSLGICAEQSAVVKAVSQGKREFRAIAVASDLDDFISPCGACRQVLAEFHITLPIYLTKPDRSFHLTSVKEILPHAFTPSALENTKKT